MELPEIIALSRQRDEALRGKTIIRGRDLITDPGIGGPPV
jgi:hypothetical protein